MEHYRSVFATTALMVVGLLAASPLLRAQDVPPLRPQATLATTSAEADTWSDPPKDKVRAASSQGAGAAGEADHNRPSEGAPKPASFTLLPPETVALFAASDVVQKGDAHQRLQAVRRHRAAKVASRSRTFNPAEAPAATPSAPVQEIPAVPQQKDARIDPIGDLLRGLGIGRNG